ncbi:hypothetical protein SEA_SCOOBYDOOBYDOO_41 [Mycobacterium phage ScoobyDoobyDoo]|nr:hypothetical protein SEA_SCOOBYDOOBYDOO_41 [Mycobacterium phage ScoobyDoobyDoo]
MTEQLFDYDSLQGIHALQGSYQVNLSWWEAGSPIYDELADEFAPQWSHHALRYDSLLMMIDGKLTERCIGCGGWKTDDHPVPPLCVFSMSDLL